MPAVRALPYEITGVDAEIGDLLPMREWAEWAKIPHHRRDGVMSPKMIEHALGVRSKSWDPKRFGDLRVLADCAHRALSEAATRPDEIDVVVLVTSTPYETMLDQDSFRMLRELGIPDDVPPLQVGAGCGGLARAMTLVGSAKPDRALILSYNLTSAFSVMEDGERNPVYSRHNNETHPRRADLWMAGALFSDAAAALVLQRRPDSEGFSFYSRDSASFGDGPAFTDPLIHYLGGGAAYPPGTKHSAEMSCFGMDPATVRDYYNGGMLLNHETLEKQRPGYVDTVRRIYTHQASPALVDEFAQVTGLAPEKAPTNARQVGNLVSASTAKLLHDDLVDGTVSPGDEVCFSVVGAGPERGAFVLPIA